MLVPRRLDVPVSVGGLPDAGVTHLLLHTVARRWGSRPHERRSPGHQPGERAMKPPVVTVVRYRGLLSLRDGVREKLLN